MGRESCLPNQFTDRAEFLTPLARIGWQAKACPTSAACRLFTLVVHCQAVASSRKIGLILTPMRGPGGPPHTLHRLAGLPLSAREVGEFLRRAAVGHARFTQRDG